jgi:hypothetical protein
MGQSCWVIESIKLWLVYGIVLPTFIIIINHER